jgi:hypothetical protein
MRWQEFRTSSAVAVEESQVMMKPWSLLTMVTTATAVV